jgi:S1-C subfamily serine protease
MTTDPLSLSQQLASVVETFGPNVVRVEARRRRPASGIVWSPDGLVVTVHHAVEWEEGISVGLGDGRTVPAKLLGRDPSTDVALLQAEGNGLSAVSPQPVSDLKVGHVVLALGRPGRSVRATWGIVSTLGNGPWRTPLGGEVERYLESDLALAPGFSGGPLVDAAGRFLGLTTAVFSRPGTAIVPSGSLARVVETLRTHGGVKRGYLGVGAYPVRLPKSLQDTTGRSSGLILLSVEPGGPADSAGLLLGDTLIALDGKPLDDLDDLLGLLAQDRAGKPVQLQVLRAGGVKDFSVKAGER